MNGEDTMRLCGGEMPTAAAPEQPNLSGDFSAAHQPEQAIWLAASAQ
jgi:hypothetical protein